MWYSGLQWSSVMGSPGGGRERGKKEKIWAHYKRTKQLNKHCLCLVSMQHRNECLLTWTTWDLQVTKTCTNTPLLDLTLGIKYFIQLDLTPHIRHCRLLNLALPTTHFKELNLPGHHFIQLNFTLSVTHLTGIKPSLLFIHHTVKNSSSHQIYYKR